MSVLIKMEMPKNCKECPFSDHEAWCLLPGGWRERYYCPDDERSDDCPLVEVPTPHGRLIDADALKTAFPTSESATNIKVSAVRRAINRMSTIIKAEGSAHEQA